MRTLLLDEVQVLSYRMIMIIIIILINRKKERKKEENNRVLYFKV